MATHNLVQIFGTIGYGNKSLWWWSQAYFGFCQICNFLWRKSSGQDCLRPSEMLAETMTALTGSGKSKFCSTRRSAGVPFLIQAIVSTEPEPSFPSLLLTTLQKLILLCQISELEVRVHSFNILRVLYRDSRLGEAVEPFVADGVKVAIEGFKAPLWAVRIIRPWCLTLIKPSHLK